jgi:hypothetical protein
MKYARNSCNGRVRHPVPPRSAAPLMDCSDMRPHLNTTRFTSLTRVSAKKRERCLKATGTRAQFGWASTVVHLLSSVDPIIIISYGKDLKGCGRGRIEIVPRLGLGSVLETGHSVRRIHILTQVN